MEIGVKCHSQLGEFKNFDMAPCWWGAHGLLSCCGAVLLYCYIHALCYIYLCIMLSLNGDVLNELNGVVPQIDLFELLCTLLWMWCMQQSWFQHPLCQHRSERFGDEVVKRTTWSVYYGDKTSKNTIVWLTQSSEFTVHYWVMFSCIILDYAFLLWSEISACIKVVPDVPNIKKNHIYIDLFIYMLERRLFYCLL